MSKQNGQKPKVDVQLGQSTRLKLLRNEPITGSSSFGPYYLYPVVTEQGVEEAFFAPEELHTVIKDRGLKSGDEFILSRVENGRPGTTKLAISILGSHVQLESDSSNEFREMMIQSMKDAAAVVAGVPELAFRTEDARAIGLSLFIAKSK